LLILRSLTFRRVIRKNVLFVAFVGMLILNACSDPDITIPKPKPPVPIEACSAYVSEGYANKISFFAGEEIQLFIDASSPISLCSLSIFNLDGNPVFSIPASLTQQEIKNTDPSINGYGYTLTIAFDLPDLISGVYTIEGIIPFLIKPKSPVDLLVVYPSNTANAYAQSGGKSLYTSNRATAVSFLRPIGFETYSQSSLNWFQHLAGISVGFICDADLEVYSTMSKGKILAIVGHNEYWTRKGRENFDRFVNSGNHALILSGNTMWWQVRYSDDLTRMICYKDWDTDPIGDALMKTVTWINPALNYHTIASIGQDFEKGGYGLRTDAGWDGFKVITPESPLFEGLELKKGDILSCPTAEYDGAPISSFDVDGYPSLDLESVGAIKGEIIAFDKGFRSKETYGTFIIYQRTISSGIIVNAGSTAWCSQNGMGGKSSEQIKKITVNAITKLMASQNVFSY
jgi:hypothetical protein